MTQGKYEGAPPAGAPSARLFLALWPDEATRTALAGFASACHWTAAAPPTPPANLHLTIHFIGNVPAESVGALADALQVQPMAVELKLGNLEVWPNGIAALVPETMPDALVQLHGDLAGALRGEGLEVESRPYRPHVTLGRKAWGTAMKGTPAAVRWTAEGHVLALSASGRYSVLRRYGYARS